MTEEMDYSLPFDFSSSIPNIIDDDDQAKVDKNIHPNIGDTKTDPNFEEYTERYNNESKEGDYTISYTYDQDMLDEKNSDNYNKYASKERVNNMSKDFEMEKVKKTDTITIDDGIGKENEKIAIINFDDNWLSQYENAKPILDNYQFKATFYIVCDYIDGKNRMTWQQIKSLQQDGHEIGSHTMNHENLDEISIDARYGEIVESKKCIEDKGIRVNSFSYPFNSGDSNQEILELVANNYDFARTAGGNSDADNDGKHEDYERFTIIGWSHDAERKKHNYSDLQMLDTFKDYIGKFDNEDKSGTGNIPIIIYHNIDDEKGTYNTSLDLFNSEMQYLYENGFKVVTMNEVFGHNSYE